MDTNNIIESGFIKAFISEYYENKIHSHYPDKDRLLYVLCNSDEEKEKITVKKIKQAKLKIKKLGNKELSFAYVLSCKDNAGANYIEPNERFDFWLNKFIEDFEDDLISFKMIEETFLNFCNKTEFDIECIYKEEDFWNFYPKKLQPKNTNVVEIIIQENELIFEIEYVIEEFKKNGWWEIDFNEFEKFIDSSKTLENLFKISELFVQLNRFEMFQSLLLKNQQKETKPEQQADFFENNFDKVKPPEIYNHFKAGLVDKGYLTEQELVEYLKAAFELKIIPETLFKFKDAPTKQKITNVFYQYFKNIAGTPHGKQKQYAALLGDYFEGYKTNNVSTNFNK